MKYWEVQLGSYKCVIQAEKDEFLPLILNYIKNHLGSFHSHKAITRLEAQERMNTGDYLVFSDQEAEDLAKYKL